LVAIQQTQIVQRRCDIGGQDLLRNRNGVRVPSSVVKFYDLLVEFARSLGALGVFEVNQRHALPRRTNAHRMHGRCPPADIGRQGRSVGQARIY
jgi:hypothetical protein